MVHNLLVPNEEVPPAAVKAPQKRIAAREVLMPRESDEYVLSVEWSCRGPDQGSSAAAQQEGDLCMQYYRSGTCAKGASCERLHGICCKASAAVLAYETHLDTVRHMVQPVRCPPREPCAPLMVGVVVSKGSRTLFVI